VLGLDHPCEFYGDEDVPLCAEGQYESALMYPVSRYVEPQVSEDDAKGVCLVYSAINLPSVGGQNGSPLDSSSLPVPTGGPCNRTSDCEIGLGCKNGQCSSPWKEAGDRCSSSAECIDSDCVNGGCRLSCAEGKTCEYGQSCAAESFACGAKLSLFGQTCRAAADCASAQCMDEDGSVRYCTKECVDDMSCPAGWSRSDFGGKNICRQRLTLGGCSLSSRNAPDNRESWLALLGVFFFFSRSLRNHIAGRLSQ
jgi:hypothetical protein